jgi:type III secretion protein R
MKTISPELLLISSIAIGLVPLLIAVGTCYLKFSIVLSLLRSGFGTQQAPSTAMVTALSVVMSLVVMQPVISKTTDSLTRLSVSDLSTEPVGVLMQRAHGIAGPWRDFLVQHCGERELSAFTSWENRGSPHTEIAVDRTKVSVITALAAFVLSEIKRGFTLGFFLLIPFFVIDLVVANLLVAMGLTMMSPVIVSLPIKLLLFVSSDGWLMLAQNLMKAYQ